MSSATRNWNENVNLEALANSVARCITDAETAGLHETAVLLHIAKLDLMVRMNCISEQELDGILFATRCCLVLSEKSAETESSRKAKSKR